MRKQLLGIFISVLVMIAPVRAFADTYSVTAKVPAPLPPTFPIVVGPTVTEQLSSGVYITGTCAVIVPSLVVLLVRNAQTIGSGNCLPSGTFSIFVGLVLGTNTIYPQFLTITGEKSGFGDPITLEYKQAATEQVSTPQQQTPGITTSDGSSALGLLFDYDIVTYNDLVTTDLEYSISGGLPPYTVTVSWGDEAQSVYRVPVAGRQSISHRYKKILPPSQITIKANDSLGGTVYQSRALVSFRQGVYVPPAQPESTEGKRSFSNLAVVLLSIGAVVFLATITTNAAFLGGGSSASLRKGKNTIKGKTRLTKK